MLKLFVLGHTYLCKENQPVRLSQKALALLTYLTLERRLHHRDHLADLLWNSEGALRNLRVELSRMRERGIDLFPGNQPMLEAQLNTDFAEWMQEPDGVPEAKLATWLSVINGLPLSGLDDVGSVAFRSWLDNQRWVINQEIESKLSRVQAKALQRGQVENVRQIRAQAKHLGLQLHMMPEPPEHKAQPTIFDRRELREQFSEIMERADLTPQLVILGGRSGSERHELLAQVTSKTDWQLIEMEASMQPDMQQAVLLHKLLKVLLPEPQAETRMLLAHPGDINEDLIRAWTLAAASGQRLMVAIHGISQLTPSLLANLHFAMNLPCSLVLVLSGSPLGGEISLTNAVGSFEQTRVHRLNLPALGVQEIMDAAGERAGSSLEERRANATLISQQSEGWDFFARVLINRPLSALSVPTPLPSLIRDTLLSDLGELRPHLRHALSRLSVVHSPITPEIAALLLGLQAPELLEEAEQRGLLVTAAPEETVQLPDLIYRPRDTDDQLALVSEPLRVALSGTLVSSERRKLRGLLAWHHLETDPALALYYAERAALPELVQQARQLLPPDNPPQPCGAPSEWGRESDVEMPMLAGPSREQRTANGYRVALENGQLQVMRYGLHTKPPLLRVGWSKVPAGRWKMLARLDVFRTAPELGQATPGFAVGVQSSKEPLIVYGTEATIRLKAGAAQRPGAQIPLGRWFWLSGQHAGGTLDICSQALDVALTVAQWHCNEQNLLPVR